MLGPWSVAQFLAAFLGWSAPSLRAQCAPPDGLDGGPCCAQAQLVIPRTKFAHNAIGICWQNCTINAINSYTAAWGFPQPPSVLPGVPPPCGWFRVPVSLNAGGAVHWRGNLHAIYARDWVEIAPTGTTYNVWRFLVNGDLGATAAAGPAPCPVPPCKFALASSPVRFTGYVDYALNCSTNSFEHAWMLTHSCDSIDHSPGLALPVRQRPAAVRAMRAVRLQHMLRDNRSVAGRAFVPHDGHRRMDLAGRLPRTGVLALEHRDPPHGQSLHRRRAEHRPRPH